MKTAALVSLAPLHTFGLDTKAQRLLAISDLSQLHALNDKPYYILGEGSNTIFLEDYEGSVLQVKLSGIEIQQHEHHFDVSVAAGENWHALVQKLMSAKIFGAENLALIPGTVGAAPIQNIGAYGVELADLCHSVQAIDLQTGEKLSFTNSECLFGYRDSVFKRQEMSESLITAVVLRFPKGRPVSAEYGELKLLGPDPSPYDIFNKVVEVRQHKLPDPRVLGNAGSFFKNPVIANEHYLLLKDSWPDIPGFRVGGEQTKVPAAWLIDRLGFKGKTIGGVACHANQPLVLVNKGNGTSADLLGLARQIRDDVLAEFAIELENEVRLVGEKGLLRL